MKAGALYWDHRWRAIVIVWMCWIWVPVRPPRGDVQRMARFIRMTFISSGLMTEYSGLGPLTYKWQLKPWDEVIQWKEQREKDVIEIIGFPSSFPFSPSFPLSLIKQYNFNSFFWKIKYAQDDYLNSTRGYMVKSKSSSLLITSTSGLIPKGISVSYAFWKCSKPIKQFYINVSTLCLLFYIFLLKLN